MIKDVFERSDGTYGYRRIQVVLERRGVRTDGSTIRSIMRDLGLQAAQLRAKVRTTVPAKDLGERPDLLRRDFTADEPGKKLCGDIPPQAGGAPSYVRTFSGWGYVAFVTDVYSRRIVGWQTTCRPVCTDLALDALKMAIWQRKHTGADLSGLVHHLRPWGAVPSHPLQGSPGRLRGSRLGGFPGRLLSASLWLRHSTRCTRPS